MPVGEDTSIGITATYAHGAASHACADISAPYDVPHGIIDASGDLDLSDAFSVAGGASPSLTPTISISVEAGVLWLESPGAMADIDGDGVLEDVDTDLTNIDLQAYIGYQPVSGLDFGIGAESRHVDAEAFGSADALTPFVRAQRTF